MNVEIANRLYEHRKQHNLSQEELAARIGVSRQAVSKWERAESSPDTDNLIELAKLYGISLDDLLFTDAPEKSQEEKATTVEDDDDYDTPEYVHVGWDGIHIVEGKDEVHVSWKGIHIKSGDSDEVKVGPEGVVIIEDGQEQAQWRRRANKFPIVLLCIVAYLIIGFWLGLWHPGWTIFLAIPVYYGLVNMNLPKSKE